MFYDLLFGDTTEISVKNEQIERAIIDRVSEVLINLKKINFQSLAKALKETLDKIDKDADIKDIQQSLEQDPVLASDVVRLANTTAFSGSSVQVVSLQMAISTIGLHSWCWKDSNFSELVDAVQQQGTEGESGSFYFRKVMTSLSKQLTYNIVRSWQLPKTIVDPIKQYVVITKVPTEGQLVNILVE